MACQRRKLRPHAYSLNISVASQPGTMLDINNREIEMNEPAFGGCLRCVEGRLLNILENRESSLRIRSTLEAKLIKGSLRYL